MLAASQREESLKFELLVPIHAEEHPTACVSFNYHRDHFGRAWKIETADGRDGAHRLRRLRPGAHHARAVQASRLRGRALAGFGARCPRALTWGARASGRHPRPRRRDLDAAGAARPDRIWPETNCYVDVWVELLPALGHPAEAALAFTVRQDFEGDHFTFFKFPLEDLEALFGLAVQELAIYDSVESHTLAQLERGRPVLIEVDSHWLPDAGAAYRKEHVKTTVAAIALDRAGERFGYFHNAGYHELSGEDYDGLFRKPHRRPALSLRRVREARRRGARRRGAAAALARAAARATCGGGRRPIPIAAWRAALPGHLETLAARDMAYFHLYAFNLPRQLGANFEMLGTYLDWLARAGAGRAGRRRRGASPRPPRRSSSSSRAWPTAAASTWRSWCWSRSKRTMIGS